MTRYNWQLLFAKQCGKIYTIICLSRNGFLLDCNHSLANSLLHYELKCLSWIGLWWWWFRVVWIILIFLMRTDWCEYSLVSNSFAGDRQPHFPNPVDVARRKTNRGVDGRPCPTSSWTPARARLLIFARNMAHLCKAHFFELPLNWFWQPQRILIYCPVSAELCKILYVQEYFFSAK